MSNKDLYKKIQNNKYEKDKIIYNGQLKWKNIYKYINEKSLYINEKGRKIPYINGQYLKKIKTNSLI